jgi:hypothetical protein
MPPAVNIFLVECLGIDKVTVNGILKEGYNDANWTELAVQRWACV